MPRGPRLAFENAFYHVFNRGINKQSIFIDRNDYLFFLAKLSRLKSKYDFSIYAICLMPNHFHISIQTRKDPISRVMSSLSTSYSMYFNRKYKHFGPVFQNRFKSILIQNQQYFIKLSQYIYMNPVKDNLAKDPIDYPYSTLKEALQKEPLKLLDENFFQIIGDIKAYEKYIHEPLAEEMKEIENLFEQEEGVLGTNLFSTISKKKYLRRKAKKVAV